MIIFNNEPRQRLKQNKKSLECEEGDSRKAERSPFAQIGVSSARVDIDTAAGGRGHQVPAGYHRGADAGGERGQLSELSSGKRKDAQGTIAQDGQHGWREMLRNPLRVPLKNRGYRKGAGQQEQQTANAKLTQKLTQKYYSKHSSLSPSELLQLLWTASLPRTG